MPMFPRCRPPSHLPHAAPNHLKAIWKVFVSESWLGKKLFKLEIGFAVSGLGLVGAGCVAVGWARTGPGACVRLRNEWTCA